MTGRHGWVRAVAAAFAAVSIVAGLLAGCTRGPLAPAPTPPSYSIVTAPSEKGCTVCQVGPGAQAGDRDAALRTAAARNDVETVRKLVALGADVNAKNDQQESAYLLAASEGATEVVDIALHNGAKVDDLDSYQGTALIRAAERGHAQIVVLLLRAGIAKDHVNRLGWQAIHEAVWLGTGDARYLATVRALVAGGVQLDRPDTANGLVPLQLAKRKGQADVVALLERATAPYVGDPTANLLSAAGAGDANSVALALRAGAKRDAKDASGATAATLAQATGNAEIVLLINS